MAFWQVVELGGDTVRVGGHSAKDPGTMKLILKIDTGVEPQGGWQGLLGDPSVGGRKPRRERLKLLSK